MTTRAMAAPRSPERTVDDEGNVEWALNGKLHRDDGPAVEYVDGSSYWFQHGRIHRDNGPAIEWADGSWTWMANDEIHRLAGPANVHVDCREEWHVFGHVLDGDDVDLFAVTPIDDRELIAQLFAAGTPMADAIGAATRIR